MKLGFNILNFSKIGDQIKSEEKKNTLKKEEKGFTRLLHVILFFSS